MNPLNTTSAPVLVTIPALLTKRIDGTESAKGVMVEIEAVDCLGQCAGSISAPVVGRSDHPFQLEYNVPVTGAGPWQFNVSVR